MLSILNKIIPNAYISDDLACQLHNKGILPPDIIDELLREGEELADDVISEWVKLLLKKHDKMPNIQGLHPPAVAKIGLEPYDLTKKGLYVQILHYALPSKHWVVVSFDGRSINYYDTNKITRNKVPDEIKKQIGYITKSSTAEMIKITMKHVEEQKGVNTCGLYALSVATDLCVLGQVEQSEICVLGEMRQHVAHCLLRDEVKTFPKRKKTGRMKTQTREDTDSIELLCICNMPQEFDKRTMQCTGPCGTWYHPKCIGHPLADTTGDEDLDLTFNDIQNWKCDRCSGELVNQGKV